LRGFFVTFEGIDGSGKSTQAAMLADWLRADGVQVVHTREPGGSPLGHVVRHVFLHRPEFELQVETEVLLMGADRAEHVARVIRPALERGQTVLCERYIDSTTAYQGYGSGCGEELLRHIRTINAFATGGLEPDVTFLLDIDPQVAASRRTGAADRVEAKGLAYQRRVREGYLHLARAFPQRIVLLNGAAPPDQLHRQIVERFLAMRERRAEERNAR